MIAHVDAFCGRHGIAGNRYFDGTLTFDDPAVADEAIPPFYTNLAFPAERGKRRSKRRQLVPSYIAVTNQRLRELPGRLEKDSGQIDQ